MSVHPRQVTPSLLQVRSILSRLAGDDAAAEVSRFLRGEFPGYRNVSVYRLVGGVGRLAGGDGMDEPPAEVPKDSGGPWAKIVVGASSVAAFEPSPPDSGSVASAVRSRVAVPILVAGAPVGALIVESASFEPLDATDERLLARVAAELGPKLTPPSTSATAGG